MKNILICGGSGFIGSNFIRSLINNYRIINLDLLTYAASSSTLNDLNNKRNYNFIKGNISNIKILKSIFKKYKPEYVINFAAETHVDRSIDSPKNFIDSNILGTFSLLECFRKYFYKYRKGKLIHISTDEVYGDILKGRSKENDQYKPSSPYAASKASSDHLVNSYVRTFKINAIVTNCSNNFGPNQHPEKLIPKMIYNIINNRPLTLYGRGKNSREWIYVNDHCEALYKVFKFGKIGEFYNIGSNKNFSNLEICKKLLNIAKEKITIGNKVKIKFIKDRPGHDLRYALNSNKIYKKLNWKSKTKFRKALEITFNWYLNNINYYKSLKKKDITNRLGKIK